MRESPHLSSVASVAAAGSHLSLAAPKQRAAVPSAGGRRGAGRRATG
ncbi:hypothetical protein QFZ98_005881 [Paraburkholderia youngii]